MRASAKWRCWRATALERCSPDCKKIRIPSSISYSLTSLANAKIRVTLWKIGVRKICMHLAARTWYQFRNMFPVKLCRRQAGQ